MEQKLLKQEIEIDIHRELGSGQKALAARVLLLHVMVGGGVTFYSFRGKFRSSFFSCRHKRYCMLQNFLPPAFMSDLWIFFACGSLDQLFHPSLYTQPYRLCLY